MARPLLPGTRSPSPIAIPLALQARLGLLRRLVGPSCSPPVGLSRPSSFGLGLDHRALHLLRHKLPGTLAVSRGQSRGAGTMCDTLVPVRLAAAQHRARPSGVQNRVVVDVELHLACHGSADRLPDPRRQCLAGQAARPSLSLSR